MTKIKLVKQPGDENYILTLTDEASEQDIAITWKELLELKKIINKLNKKYGKTN